MHCRLLLLTELPLGENRAANFEMALDARKDYPIHCVMVPQGDYTGASYGQYVLEVIHRALETIRPKYTSKEIDGVFVGPCFGLQPGKIAALEDCREVITVLNASGIKHVVLGVPENKASGFQSDEGVSGCCYHCSAVDRPRVERGRRLVPLEEDASFIEQIPLPVIRVSLKPPVCACSCWSFIAKCFGAGNNRPVAPEPV